MQTEVLNYRPVKEAATAEQPRSFKQLACLIAIILEVQQPGELAP